MLIKVIAPIWIYDGPSPWHFATINKKVSDKIKKLPILKRGWGSVPVNVLVGKTKWKTSIFPDKEGIYLLPIKKSVRLAEDIRMGMKVNLNLEIIEDHSQEQT